MVEQLGFNDVSNEIVDNNSNEERELVEEINTKLTGLQCDQLADTNLEKMDKEQLAAFLTKNYFDGSEAKSYSDCKNTGEILNFSMKAALQLLAEKNENKYDEKGNLTTDGKTATQLLKERGGINLDNDNVLIKVLQNIVGAHPDGKPGPQTIALVISALGGDVSSIYEGVNNLYSNNEKFRIQNVAEFKIGDTNFKYDKNQFNLTIVNEKVYLTLTSEHDGKEIVMKDGKPTLEGFTFENGWIKKANTNNNTPNQGHNPKHAENPPVPRDWDKNIDTTGGDCTEKTSNFIKNNINKLSFTEENKKDYLLQLDDIFKNPKKSATFYSFIKLDSKKFWGNYRLTKNDLENFNNNAGKGKGRCFDATGRSAVFHEATGIAGGNFHDYCSRNGTYLIKHNESSKTNVFEVDGSGTKDDYRFDSVEAFCRYMEGKEIKSARSNVRNLAKEGPGEIANWSEKIKPEALDKTADLYAVGFGDSSKEGFKKRKTFISLLELPDNFWKNYQLSTKDIQNFAEGMNQNAFDRGNATVFHPEGSGKRGINKDVAMFEVDGTASSGHRSDRRFTSVENFFQKLNYRIIAGHWKRDNK